MSAEMPWNEIAQKVEAHYDADILIFFGPITRKWDDFLIDVCKSRNKRKNVLLVLSSLGGDAHAAYRIARCLQRYYHKLLPSKQIEGEVIIFVPSICASAGTLITLAGDRHIFSDHAELGPLDVQIRKPEEVGERTSGLTPLQAVKFLQEETQRFFKAQFRALRFDEDLEFSTRMATDVTTELATGLLSTLYNQIDPLRLAEYYRINQIGEHYGRRIQSKNVKDGTIKKLLEHYPSHECSIDCVEAAELFNKIEPPTADLEEVWRWLQPFANQCLAKGETGIFYATDSPVAQEPPKEKITNGKTKPKDGGDGQGNGKPAEDGKKSEAGVVSEPAEPANRVTGQTSSS